LLSFVLVTVTRLTLVFLLLAASLLAQPPAPEKTRAQSYVTDLAGVVTPDWKQRIERLCAELDSKTQSQMAVVTIRSLEGEPIEDYANRWLRAWGVGRKTNKGALMLLVIQDKRMRLEVGYGLEPAIPDGFSGGLLRDMREPLGRSSYGEAIYGGVRTVARRIAQQAGVKLDESGAAPRPIRRRAADSSSWPVLLKILLFILFIGLMSGRYWFLGPLLGGGWSGSSGGGFGGGGGGGGFGGFGGGDSGGGGASSDW
jgi:uncharacterized protein